MPPPAVEPIGSYALIREFGLKVPPPAVRSEAIVGMRRSIYTLTEVIEQYPRNFIPKDAIGHLKFALRYEPVALSVLDPVLHAINPTQLETWIRAEAQGVYARRAWYLYELLTGRTLDIPDSGRLAYAELLNPELHITAASRRSPRHRIDDNLLGDPSYCPLLRRTEALQNAINAGFDKETRAMVESCDPSILARAIQFLYTQETKSSFAIESEVPSHSRTERFVRVLAHAAEFRSSDPHAYVELQNTIVDPRYAAKGWRDVQNYVGRTRSDGTEHVYFVCPKPEDVPSLMQGWIHCVARLFDSALDPISMAAAVSFGFVFLHPFEDGNGRIHRFLIHHVLARENYTPAGILFPVSAVMLRNRRAYDAVLNAYSTRIQPFIEYTLSESGEMTVLNETARLYRYWDATPFAEYLYGCVAETIRQDLKEEINYLALFDASVRAAMEIVDMPDRRASLLVRLILQNNGALAAGRRALFPEVTDPEIEAIEAALRAETEAAKERA